MCSAPQVSCQASSGSSGQSSCVSRAMVALIEPPQNPALCDLVRCVAAKSHQHHDRFSIGNRRGILAHSNHPVPLARKTIDLVLMLLLRVAADEHIRRRILLINFPGDSHRSPLLEDYTAKFTRSTTTPAQSLFVRGHI